MRKLHTEEYEHNGRIFAIVTFAREAGYLVKIFLSGKPIGPDYTVSYENEADFNTAELVVVLNEGSAIDHLINAAKSWINANY
jgi:hypothetical protein